MWRVYLSFLMLFKITLSNPTPKISVLQPYVDNPAVKLLQEYIQIDTSREENIECAVNFWKRQAADLGLPFMVYRPSGKPICVITWTGANPKLPSIILNSHIDVVPVDEQEWTYPPFSGYIDKNGNMYGRGTQDTKSVALHYLEAIRKLKEDNVTLQRTLHITLMPDEETGGFNGMVPFVETEEFRALNPGFIFDEGLSYPDGTLYATYQDKRAWQLNLTIHGAGGHGSSFPDGSAMQKVQQLMDITTKFREQQKQIMVSRDVNDFGSYTTINMNIIKGGVVPNIIPSRVTVVIDMRLAVTAEVHEVEALIQSWIAQVGNETELSFIRKIDVSEATILDDTNPYWVAVVDAVKEMDMKIMPIVCPATSDMVILRNRGYPAIGFAYRPYTVPLLHAADEYLNVATFLKGIEVYAIILKKVGNIL
ncbi:unnamed protein product [Parnassius mnemosyne]|uniref:N-acyl-aliphatic-L-amino acid amidohydrolase n=1 Tax=Parnassius mnemosyne TaxID=213953 RepID=A0AAV1LZQ8_9NEOP